MLSEEGIAMVMALNWFTLYISHSIYRIARDSLAFEHCQGKELGRVERKGKQTLPTW